MAAYGLYTHIQSNRWRSSALLLGLFLLIYLLVFAGALLAEAGSNAEAPIGWLLAQAFQDLLAAAPFATIGALLWIAVAYWLHQFLIDRMTGAGTVSRQEQPRLYNLLENLCISRGIPMPKLKIADSQALNAYATGLNQRQYAVTVTRGLLEALDDAELEAVLGHELTHIRNGDVRLLVIAIVIAGVVSFFGELMFRSLRFGNLGTGRRSSGSSSSSDRKGGGGGAVIALLIALALVVVAWILALVIRFALSRRREFLADAGSVELTRNPDAMIRALRKIEGHSDLPKAPSGVMEMCVDNPRGGIGNLFSTHPTIDARIEALVQFAGGHDLAALAEGEPATEPPAAIADESGPWGTRS